MDPALFAFAQGNSENLLGLSGAPGGGRFGGAENNNDRVLLQLLNQRQQQQQQQASYDPFQQALLQRELERETLLQRLNAMNGAGLLGLQSYGGLGGADAAALGLSQGSSAFDQSRLSSLLGSPFPPQLASPLLQGGLAGLAPGASLGGGPPGLVHDGPNGLSGMTFDDSITLEARSKQAFPVKLYRMLERAERNGQEDIISFIDDGKAFAIHKPRAFETDIMPSYFNSHRMSSFQRQLNIYVSHFASIELDESRRNSRPNLSILSNRLQGFERINDGIQKGAYRHKYFIKGKKNLLEKIKRPQKLRHGGSAADDDDEATKLQTLAAEHLVGLSRTSGAESTKSDKSESTAEKDY